MAMISAYWNMKMHYTHVMIFFFPEIYTFWLSSLERGKQKKNKKKKDEIAALKVQGVFFKKSQVSSNLYMHNSTVGSPYLNLLVQFFAH